MGNLVLRTLRSIDFRWTVKGLGWYKSRFPSLLIELPPHIQQAARNMMIPTDLRGILFSLFQQLDHLQGCPPMNRFVGVS
jgi:hypothetical protein